MEKNEYQLVTERLVLHPWREWEADQVRILPVATGKKRYLPLLLIGDEQESMIDRYLDRGEMFVMRNREDKPVAIAVVTDEGDGILELKSMKTLSFYRNCGFSYSHTVADFFIKNYDHPIIEDGKMLKDMIYFKRDIRPS